MYYKIFFCQYYILFSLLRRNINTSQDFRKIYTFLHHMVIGSQNFSNWSIWRFSCGRCHPHSCQHYGQGTQLELKKKVGLGTMWLVSSRRIMWNVIDCFFLSRTPVSAPSVSSLDVTSVSGSRMDCYHYPLQQIQQTAFWNPNPEKPNRSNR